MENLGDMFSEAYKLIPDVSDISVNSSSDAWCFGRGRPFFVRAGGYCDPDYAIFSFI